MRFLLLPILLLDLPVSNVLVEGSKVVGEVGVLLHVLIGGGLDTYDTVLFLSILL